MNAVVDHQAIFRFGGREYNLLHRTHLMGILNVTPDSFSDGGKFYSVDAAVEHAMRMIADGADIIDVGGESTRPKSQAYGEGADVVDVEEELRRVIPVIEQIARKTDVPISVDTYKSQVAREALRAGAVIVNDISGFTFDPAMISVIAEARASAVIMHIKGTPKTMQQNPEYLDLIGEINAFLEVAVAKGRAAGIEQIIVDPGIGFGKTLRHNLELIACLRQFGGLGCPILVGPSRKSFIGMILDTGVDGRLEGSLAASVACVLNGARFLRVHDVRETKRAVMIADAINHATEPT